MSKGEVRTQLNYAVISIQTERPSTTPFKQFQEERQTGALELRQQPSTILIFLSAISNGGTICGTSAGVNTLASGIKK